VKDDPTILGDRETVELLSSQPELLAIADAVRATQREDARAWIRLPRLLVAAAALAGLAAVFAFAFTGGSGGERTRAGIDSAKCPGSEPLGACTDYTEYAYLSFGALDYRIARDDGAISTIAVTIRNRFVGGTAELRVLVAGRVVFSEPVPLSEVAAPTGPTGYAGLVLLSEWSGALSPNQWDGGCQDAPYRLLVLISVPTQAGDAKGPTGGAGTQIAESETSPAFNCQHARAAGPTGTSGPTGAEGPSGGAGPTG